MASDGLFHIDPLHFRGECGYLMNEMKTLYNIISHLRRCNSREGNTHAYVLPLTAFTLTTFSGRSAVGGCTV